MKTEEIRTLRYEILSLDVWGNARDGWDLNEVLYSGVFVDVPVNAPANFSKILADAGYLRSPRIKLDEQDGGHPFMIYLDFAAKKYAGRPCCQLRLVETCRNCASYIVSSEYEDEGEGNVYWEPTEMCKLFNKTTDADDYCREFSLI